MEETKTNAAVFAKDALIASEKYKRYADILSITLDGGKEYTAAEVDKILADFLSRPVEETVNGGRK